MNGKVLGSWIGHWRWLAVAGAYVGAVVVIANVAFGGSLFFSQSARLARTGSYGTRLAVVAPVDPNTLGKAVAEAGGGPPTIGRPLPAADNSSTSAPAAQPVASAHISLTTTPTYTAVTKVSTNPYASLLALLNIPTNLTFPKQAHPHRR